MLINSTSAIQRTQLQRHGVKERRAFSWKSLSGMCNFFYTRPGRTQFPSHKTGALPPYILQSKPSPKTVTTLESLFSPTPTSPSLPSYLFTLSDNEGEGVKSIPRMCHVSGCDCNSQKEDMRGLAFEVLNRTVFFTGEIYHKNFDLEDVHFELSRQFFKEKYRNDSGLD